MFAQTNKIQVSDEFKNWALSYTGFWGGNIKSDIWFCGIEWGGEDKKEEFSFAPLNEPLSLESKEDRYEKFLKWQFNWRLIKLYCAIKGKPLEKYKEIFEVDNLMRKDGNIFHLNLYPFAFPEENEDKWEEKLKWYFEKTGLPTKSLYKAWCQLYRFPKIYEWMKKNNPKLIICIGKSYYRDFYLAFDKIENIIKSDNEKGQIKYKIINDGKTLLCIIPFFGKLLFKDLDIKNIGEQIYNLTLKELNYNLRS